MREALIKELKEPREEDESRHCLSSPFCISRVHSFTRREA